jgi:hypothetical protein
MDLIDDLPTNASNDGLSIIHNHIQLTASVTLPPAPRVLFVYP